MGVFDWIGKTAEGVWDGVSGAGGGAPVQREAAQGAGVAPTPSPGNAGPASANATSELFGHYAADAAPAEPGLLDKLGGLASGAASAVGGAAKFVYDGYQKQTDFKAPQAQLNKGVDWVENQSDRGGQKMVEDAKGIPVLEQLAQASAFVSHLTSQVGGGIVKGAGDLAGGVMNTFFHPIDAALGLAGIAEHSGIPGLGSTLKTVHGLYDLAANGGGEYGNSVGDLANHVLNPLQSMKDDGAANTRLATGILAPGELDKKPGQKGVGWDVWKDKPVEALSRAATNLFPMVLGVGEAAVAEDAALTTRPGTVPPPPESIPPTLRSATLPVENPVTPRPVGPTEPPPTTPNPSTKPGLGPDTIPNTVPDPPTIPGLQPDVVPDTIPTPPTKPGLGPDTIPNTVPDPPTIPGLQPDVVPDTIPTPPTKPGLGPDTIPTPPTKPGLGPVDTPVPEPSPDLPGPRTVVPEGGASPSLMERGEWKRLAEEGIEGIDFKDPWKPPKF
jgi:hypothetical protein